MVKDPRFVGSVLGFAILCTACVTVQAPQCPSPTQPPASVSAASRSAPLSELRDEDDDVAAPTQLHVLVTDTREGARVQAHCASAACPSLVSTFNQHFKRWLTFARGRWLVITVVDDKTGLPPKYQADYLPEPLAQLRTRMAKQPSGRLDRTLGDGTRVVVLYGKDEDAVLAQIDQLTFDKP
jgi:hypothetical protein